MSTQRDATHGQLTGVAAGWASGSRRDLTRDGALAAIRAISSDPDRLARAASIYAAPFTFPLPWEPDAVQLLVDAGADVAALERYVAQRRAPRRGFDLGKFAEGLGHV